MQSKAEKQGKSPGDMGLIFSRKGTFYFGYKRKKNTPITPLPQIKQKNPQKPNQPKNPQTLQKKTLSNQPKQTKPKLSCKNNETIPPC